MAIEQGNVSTAPHRSPDVPDISLASAVERPDVYGHVTVFIPTLNEAESIAETVTDVASSLPGAEIVVIDGLSTDETVAIAKKCGVGVWQCTSRGKGAAIRFGLQSCDSEYVVMVDGDGSYDVRVLPALIKKMGGYDAIQANRIEVGDAIPPINRIGNRVLSWLARHLYKADVKDVCSGLWVMRWRFYKQVDIKEDGFTLEVNLFTEANKGCFRYDNSEKVGYFKRKGRSKLTILDGFKIARFLFKEAMS